MHNSALRTAVVSLVKPATDEAVAAKPDCGKHNRLRPPVWQSFEIVSKQAPGPMPTRKGIPYFCRIRNTGRPSWAPSEQAPLQDETAWFLEENAYGLPPAPTPALLLASPTAPRHAADINRLIEIALEYDKQVIWQWAKCCKSVSERKNGMIHYVQNKVRL
jgi:hypothetical protein